MLFPASPFPLHSFTVWQFPLIRPRLDRLVVRGTCDLSSILLSPLRLLRNITVGFNLMSVESSRVIEPQPTFLIRTNVVLGFSTKADNELSHTRL